MKAQNPRLDATTRLSTQERELADQLFKLKFQLNMGQTESLKKIAACEGHCAREDRFWESRSRAVAAQAEKK